jgi:hypothetical protein
LEDYRRRAGDLPAPFVGRDSQTFKRLNGPGDGCSPPLEGLVMRIPEPSAASIEDRLNANQQGPQCGYGDVIIPMQPATHVYLNPHDQIVIRQENWLDDDQLFLSSEMIPTLIARLKELAGLK